MGGPDLISLVTLLAAKRRAPHEAVRAYMFGDDVMLYARINRRACAGKVLDCLVLADITVSEGKQRQGVFSRALDRLEHELPALDLQAIVVENIVNEHLRGYLLRRGYLPINEHPITLYRESPYG